MSAPFALPPVSDQPDVADLEVCEPFNISTDYVDGAALIRLLPDGFGHMLL